MLSLPAAAQNAAHPLVGKILDTQTGVLTELSDPTLIPALFPCGAITLLGEVHDNPDHHKMRATLVKAHRETGNCGGSAAFVFEHIGADQKSGLERYYNFGNKGLRNATVAELFRDLDWSNSGWPTAELFEPLFNQVIRSGGVITAGNPSREEIRKISKQGLRAIDAERSTRLRLDKPLAPALEDDLLSELEASHCGLMPKSAFGNMAGAQRFKDAHIAEVASMRAFPTIVVFAGNGHVRTDRGIPYYIRQRAPNQKVIAVAFVEVEDGKFDPTSYGPRDPDGKPATDYVAFAAPAKRDDPCAAMREQFKAKPVKKP